MPDAMKPRTRCSRAVPAILLLVVHAAALAHNPAPPNDEPAAAQVIGPALPVVIFGTTVGASNTAETGELPDALGRTDGPDVFYRFAPPEPGAYRIQLLPWKRVPLRSLDRQFVVYVRDEAGGILAGARAAGGERDGDGREGGRREGESGAHRFLRAWVSGIAAVPEEGQGARQQADTAGRTVQVRTPKSLARLPTGSDVRALVSGRTRRGTQRVSVRTPPGRGIARAGPAWGAGSWVAPAGAGAPPPSDTPRRG